MDTILDKLYMLAARENIQLYFCPIPNKKGCALKYKNYYAVAINYERTKTEKEEKQVLAEEIAHCLSNNLYPPWMVASPFSRQIVAKAEKEAQDYASILLAPLEALKPLLNLPYYEIAEELNIDEKTVLKAIEYYQRKGEL